MPKSRRRRFAPPWNLFHHPPPTPIWAELPRPVKDRLMELLVSLLREERKRRSRRPVNKESNHE